MFRGIYYEQGTPDSTAAGRHQGARVGGCVGIHTGSASLLSCHVIAHQACLREGRADNWLHYADIYPNDIDVLSHSSLNVLITSYIMKTFGRKQSLFLISSKCIFVL